MAQKYRLNTLGWYNFEKLVQTLLKVIIGPGVSSFGGSKDKGRDATFHGEANYPNEKTRWSGDWIFQVKFIDYEEVCSNDAQNRLKNELKNEIHKILYKYSFKPDNYILLTNISISGDNKDKIIEEVKKSFKQKINIAIVDGDEICEYLDIKPDIRKSFPQLLGISDLERIVNHEIYQRSLAYFKKWESSISKFVETDSYFKSLSILKKSHFVLIDGPPEVGKSLISAICSIVYSVDGFEVYDISNPDDFFKLHNPDAHQFFIADDVVGSISYDPGLGDKWSRDFSKVLVFLNKDHKLIWTARKYILQEALHESRIGEINREFPGISEVTVEVKEISTVQKAEILYKHAKYENLNKNQIYNIKKYARKIIFHDNFTPERIRQLINDIIKPHQESIIWDEIDIFLKNPGIHWEKAYSKLNDSEKVCLNSMLDFDRPPLLSELSDAYNNRCLNMEDENQDINHVLSCLNHSFLNINIYKGFGEKIFFQHPSIRDLLISRLKKEPSILKRHIQLSSPQGLAEVIRGFQRNSNNDENSQHLISLHNSEQFDLLLDRIGHFSDSTLSEDEWNALLSSLSLIISFQEIDDLESISRAELREFTQSDPGKIVEITLNALGSATTYDNCRRFSLSVWINLLLKFYSLSVFIIPPPRVNYLHEILNDKKFSVYPEIGFKFLKLLKENEPLHYGQYQSFEKIKLINKSIHKKIDELIVMGSEIYKCDPDCFDYSEYYEWESDSRSSIDFFDEFYDWSKIKKPNDKILNLETLLAEINPLEEDEEDDEDYERIDEEYWTIERLFEDL